jgi:hypothetical protein
VRFVVVLTDGRRFLWVDWEGVIVQDVVDDIIFLLIFFFVYIIEI